MSVRSDTQRSSLEKGRVINFPYYIFSCVFKMNYYRDRNDDFILRNILISIAISKYWPHYLRKVEFTLLNRKMMCCACRVIEASWPQYGLLVTAFTFYFN